MKFIKNILSKFHRDKTEVKNLPTFFSLSPTNQYEYQHIKINIYGKR